jgi:hypothetical protein
MCPLNQLLKFNLSMRCRRIKPPTGNQRRSKRSPQVLTKELPRPINSKTRTTRSKSLFVRITSTMRSNRFRPSSASRSKQTKITRRKMHAPNRVTIAATSAASSAAAIVCSPTRSLLFPKKSSQGSVYSETLSSTQAQLILIGQAMLNPSISSSQPTGNSLNSSQACSETYNSSS